MKKDYRFMWLFIVLSMALSVITVASCGEPCNPKEFQIYDKFHEVGFYNGFSLGMTMLRIKGDEDFRIEKTGFCIDVYQGYKCEDIPLKFEQKICLNCHCLGKINDENKFIIDSDHCFNSFGITENIIVDPSKYGSGGPYLGLGIGYKELSGTRDELFGNRIKKRKIKTMGMQGIVGANLVLDPVCDLQVEYKCFMARKHAFIEHSLCLNFQVFI